MTRGPPGCQVPARKPVNRRRDEVIERLETAGREHSTATVLFHSALADRFGLNATDSKTMDLIARLGPLTAGQIAQHTGLASASVTALIDRLEEKGFVRRVRDVADRRRVIVELVPEAVNPMGDAFQSLRRSLDDLWAPYTVEQLEVIHDFLVRSASRLQQLCASPPPRATGADPGGRAGGGRKPRTKPRR